MRRIIKESDIVQINQKKYFLATHISLSWQGIGDIPAGFIGTHLKAQGCISVLRIIFIYRSYSGEDNNIGRSLT